MTYIDDNHPDKGTVASAANMPKESFPISGSAPPRFLVNIINKRELELLEELLAQNTVKYIVRSASRKNRRSDNTGFSMLGKDIYVDGDHYDRARAALADYYLGVEQTTADTNAVPAARRQQSHVVHRKRYSIKQLILWLLLATVGYSVLFMLWMGLMK